MITQYRPPSATKIHSNLASSRQRNNPTNTHTRIFHFADPKPRPASKCTPTFHSNIFYQTHAPNTQKCDKIAGERSENVYRNDTREKRVISLSRGMREGDGVGVGIKEFEDSGKK
jgi:hypothetical protein